jgi:hypothetical protein
MSFQVTGVEYGDVNGDGREDAMVLTVCNTGGSGAFSDAFVFSASDGHATLLAHLAGGDRADGGFGDIEAIPGGVVVDRYVNNGSGACCPDFVDRIAFRLTGGKLKEPRRLSRTRVIEDDGLDGSRPLTFARGASSATINAATLTRVTYRLSARQGQTMTVRLESRRAPTATLIDSNGKELATITAGHDWRGTLPASGVYRLRVQSHRYVTMFRLVVGIR